MQITIIFTNCTQMLILSLFGRKIQLRNSWNGSLIIRGKEILKKIIYLKGKLKQALWAPNRGHTWSKYPLKTINFHHPPLSPIRICMLSSSPPLLSTYAFSTLSWKDSLDQGIFVRYSSIFFSNKEVAQTHLIGFSIK